MHNATITMPYNTFAEMNDLIAEYEEDKESEGEYSRAFHLLSDYFSELVEVDEQGFYINSGNLNRVILSKISTILADAIAVAKTGEVITLGKHRSVVI